MVLNLHHEFSNPNSHGQVNDDNGSLGIHWIEGKPVLKEIIAVNQKPMWLCLSIHQTQICVYKKAVRYKYTNIDNEDMSDDDVYYSHKRV